MTGAAGCCSSYTYYNRIYFGRKVSRQDPRGSKNLDILTSGLASWYNPKLDSDARLVKAIDDWNEGREGTSYQTIVSEMEMGQIVSVNGDEDNEILNEAEPSR